MGILRFSLAIVVLLHHLPDIPGKFLFLGGPEAVEAFYMISGFYMALVLDRKYSHCTKSYKTFILSRFLRIYPQYLIVLFITVLSYYTIAKLFMPPYENFISVYFMEFSALNLLEKLLVISTSLSIFGQELLVWLFDGKYHLLHPISIGWSLACELSFYITAPIIFHFSKKSLFILLVFFLLLRFALLPVMGITFVYFLPVTQYPLFLIGFLIYRSGDFKIPKPLMALSVIIFIAFMLFGAVTINSTMNVHLRIFTSEAVSVGRVGSAAYWLFYPSLAVLLWKIHKLNLGPFDRLDRLLGNISYPVYLTHRIVINFFSLALMSSIFVRIDIFFYAAIFIVTILISVLLETVVQRRVDRFRGRFVKRAMKIEPG